MDFVKKIPPVWAAVAVLVVIVIVLLFRQRRSGYTPTAGTPITLMDLQEFSIFTAEQKRMYSDLLTTSDILSQLKRAADSKSVENLQRAIGDVMNTVLNATESPPPPTNSQVKCAPGTYSSTGNSPCTPCPPNTYCSALGTTIPTMCPAGTTSSLTGATSSATCMKKLMK